MLTGKYVYIFTTKVIQFLVAISAGSDTEVYVIEKIQRQINFFWLTILPHWYTTVKLNAFSV